MTKLMQEVRDKQQLISSYIGKLLRDTFGKGPESVYVTMGYTFINIYLRNFLSPSERVLMAQDQVDILEQMRHKLMQSLSPEIRSYIELVTGVQLREIYFDWNLHNQSGLIFGISSLPFPGYESIQENYHGKNDLEREVVSISQQAQKVPEEIYSCELSPRNIVVIRNGILVRIEKELIREGLEDILKNVKRKLEKSYLHNNNHMEEIIKKRIIDVFVDWNLELDKSVIAYILNPALAPPGTGLERVDYANSVQNG